MLCWKAVRVKAKWIIKVKPPIYTQGTVYGIEVGQPRPIEGSAEMATPLCISCGSNKWEADVVLMTGKWSRLINYSNKKYDEISCVNCGYTMFFKKDANFSPLELMFG